MAIRMDNWKGIIEKVHKGNKSMQLFNLYTDPVELFDVAKQHPNVVTRLKEKIRKARERPEVERFGFLLDK